MNRKLFKVRRSRWKVPSSRSDAGFTLVELLVSAGLSLFVLGVVYSVYRVQTRTVKSQESRLVATEEARAALDLMVREIRNTGYFPAATGACTVPANTNGIVAAGAQNFQSVYDANGDGDCTDPNEDVTYAFATADCPADLGNITRTDNNTLPVTAQPLTNCNIPSPGGVPGNNFVLTYFPQQTGAAAPPPYCFPDGTPAGCNGALNLATIQRVLVTLNVRSASPDTEFGGGQLNATMTSNVDMRNRGLPQ